MILPDDPTCRRCFVKGPASEWLWRPYRPQMKGKVESKLNYVRRNFQCDLQRREPICLPGVIAHLRACVWEVANRCVHGATRTGGDGLELWIDSTGCRWMYDRLILTLMRNCRRWHEMLMSPGAAVLRCRDLCRETGMGSRSLVPGRTALRRRADRSAWPGWAEARCAEHHRGIPLGARGEGKILVRV